MANFVFLNSIRINLDAVAYVDVISTSYPRLGVCFIGSSGNDEYDLKIYDGDVQIFEDAMRALAFSRDLAVDDPEGV